jgi:hypothetical protein
MNNNLFSLPPAFPVIALALLCGGCANTYRFQVDAVAQRGQTQEPRYSYRLVPAMPDSDVNSLLSRRLARHLKTALSSKGLFEAPAGVEPALKIAFYTRLEGPFVVTHTVTEPVVRYGLVSTMDGSPVEGPGANAPSGGAVEMGPPEYGPSRLVVRQVREYRKSLRLTAHRAGQAVAAAPAEPLWSVSVETQDESRNLDRYVHLMVAAAMDAIGEDLKTPRRLRLTDRDGRVLFVQTGLQD